MVGAFKALMLRKIIAALLSRRGGCLNLVMPQVR
jgi:hypothetical protein